MTGCSPGRIACADHAAAPVLANVWKPHLAWLFPGEQSCLPQGAATGEITKYRDDLGFGAQAQLSEL